MPVDKDTQKAALKEGIKEWMDEQFTMVGKFTIGALLVAAFGGLVWLAMIGAGWHK